MTAMHESGCETVCMHAAHRQAGYEVRFEWGMQGASAILDGVDVAVVVDVLSFTTTVSVAVDAGVRVFPHGSQGPGAQRYARERGAVLAVSRCRARPGDLSLSPASFRSTPAPARVVLPSPNGSAIAEQLALRTEVCVAACLRNARVVGQWIRSRHGVIPTVAVIAAGERWGDRTLRPAVEDLWGAGAVISQLGVAAASLSPEAKLACVGYDAVRGHELDALMSCASGRELVAKGYRSDVQIAAEANLGEQVPLLVDGCFASARSN